METKRKKRLRGPRLILSLAVLAAAAALIYAVAASRSDLTPQGILSAIKSLGGRDSAAEFTYEDSADSVFADLDGGLVSVSKRHIRIFDRTGGEKAAKLVSLSRPMVVTGGGLAAVYDAGGTFLRVFDGAEERMPAEAEKPVISASLNENGWLALCAEDAGYKGSVTVYDSGGKAVYRWYSAENHILSAEVSPDNKRLAVLTLGEVGGGIVFLRLDSEDEEARFALDGEVILDIKYKDNTAVTAVTKSAAITVKSSGEEAGRYDFSAKTLTAFTLGGDGYAVLVLSENTVGSGGSEVCSVSGEKLLGSAAYEDKVLGVSASGGGIAVLTQGMLRICGKNMEETASFVTDSGAGRVIMRGDGKAVVAGAYRAVVY